MCLKKYLSNKLTIFSKYNCLECNKIKQFLDSNRYEYTLINIENISDDEVFDLIDELKILSGSNSFPFCFHEGLYCSPELLKKKLIFNLSEDF